MIHSELFFNRCFDKGKLKGLISWSLRNYGEATTLELVEKLKDVGFFWATKAGISLSIDDLKIPAEKSALLLEAEQISENASKQFLSGNVTTVERLQQLIDAWHRTSEVLKHEVVQTFRKSDPLNPVYMMAFSGARGNISQVRQLVGMRGLMADPQGRIIDFPIRSNFREGLTLTEYVISCYGARKGIVDTALRTATSGYLTRRLVDVAQHVVVGNYDCETNQSIVLGPLKQGNKILLPLSERILGRVLAEDLSGIASRNQCISQYAALQIQQIRESILVRSPLVCESRTGICQLCYGWSLAHNELVSIGEAVGIIAAQSIGEPGTQLTMRTFHTGGVFSGEIIDQIQAPASGLVSFPKLLKGTLVRTSYGKIGFLTREPGVLNLLLSDTEIKEVAFPAQTILFVREGQKVLVNETVGEYASSATDQDQGIQSTQLITAPQNGEVFFEDVVILKSEEEEETQSYQLGSFWLLKSHLHPTHINQLGTFNFVRGDFLKNRTSFATTNVFDSTNSSLVFFQHEKLESTESSYSNKLFSIISPIKEINVNNFIYSESKYLAQLNFLNQNQFKVSSNYRPFLSLCSKTFISFLELFVKTKNDFNGVKTLYSSLLLSVSQSWFFLSNEFFIEFQTPKIYKQKLFEYASKSEVASFGPVIKKPTTVKLRGAYIFKSFRETNTSKSVLNGFYFNNQRVTKVKVISDSVTWKIKPLSFTLSKLSLFEACYQNAVFTNKSFCFAFQPFVVSHKSDGSYELTKRYCYPILPQLSKNFLLSFFNEPKPSLSNVLTIFKASKNARVISALHLVTKVCLLSFSSSVSLIVNPSSSLFSKQNLDAILFTRSHFSIQLNELTNSNNIPFAAVQVEVLKNIDHVEWKPTFSQVNKWRLYSSCKVVVPQLKPTAKKQDFEIFSWNPFEQKLIGNKIILGEVERKTTQPIEIFKLSSTSNNERILSVQHTDLFKISTLTNVNNCFLGSLIRPGDEIFEDSTIKESGQVISIKKDSFLVRKALPILFSSKANFHVFHGDFIQKGLPLITLTYKRLTTGDIVQGIPRIEQLFEARQTTTLLHEQLQELFETYKTRMTLDLAVRKSFQKIQRILIDSIQKVYQSQGVTISDKHLEIIVRQMTSTVRILEGGRTRLLRGELKSIDWIEKINSSIDIQKAEYEPILLGITKASLETESFISAASFQETTRTLSRAAIEGRTDFLRGLKENVILGHRIPAGTGAPLISYLTKFSTEGESSTDLSSELNFLIKEH